MFSSGVNLGGGGRVGGSGGIGTPTQYDASSGNWPPSAGFYVVSVASPVDVNGNVKFPVNALIINRAPVPTNSDADWFINT